ncbi:MAG: hypothetical protein LC685_03355 [Actinobacteria bacterium]|nr:hypothetical protein [Actinomycetota bacterium]
MALEKAAPTSSGPGEPASPHLQAQGVELGTDRPGSGQLVAVVLGEFFVNTAI